MQNKNHNGWYNYETWVVALWLDNEQGSQEFFANEARSALRNPGAYHTPGMTQEEMATLALADTLKAFHEEALPELQGFVADLLSAAMSEVNWHEIAKHLVEDALANAE